MEHDYWRNKSWNIVGILFIKMRQLDKRNPIFVNYQKLPTFRVVKLKLFTGKEG